MMKNMQLSTEQYVNNLEKLVSKGLEIGLSDIKELTKQIESLKATFKDEIIRVVLLGSFSDGKTTIMAAMMEKLEDSMKIDSDESSDELKIYRPDGLKKGFEFVDTPGLFGTKEKEVDGKTLKFSDITKKYISEAHIVIYVCDAVVPLKESHGPIIKWIMRDLNKLENSIFVINKMDETGYDITDSEEYDEIAKIKRENLINRLRDVIDLTSNEESKLHIACVAANPKGKGLQHWFSKIEDYKARSHIDVLNQEVNSVINSSVDNKGELILSSTVSSVKDSLELIRSSIELSTNPLVEAMQKCKDSCAELKTELNVLKNEIIVNKNDSYRQLDTYRQTILSEIDSSSQETISSVIQNSLGMQNGELTFYVLNREIDNILSGCINSIQSSSSTLQTIFSQKFAQQEGIVSDAFNKGVGLLKNVKVDNNLVLKTRDIFFKNVKFKPWGATKLAGKITTIAGRTVAVATIVIQAYKWYKSHQEAKKFNEFKCDLKNNVNEVFSSVYEIYNNEEKFINAFSPEYFEMYKALEERSLTLEKLSEQRTTLDDYSREIELFLEKC